MSMHTPSLFEPAFFSYRLSVFALYIHCVLYIWGCIEIVNPLLPTDPRWVVVIVKIAPLVMQIANFCAENVQRCLSSSFHSTQSETYNLQHTSFSASVTYIVFDIFQMTFSPKINK